MVFENYDLLEQIGSGSSSQVYLAKSHATGALVAIKRLKALTKATSKIRFQREFRAMRQFEHPGIVRVLDFFEHDERPWLVMEFVDGCDLNEWLKQRRPLKTVLEMFEFLAAALEVVHGKGFVHRDIKPQNIFVRKSTHLPVLFDFGLVKNPEQLSVSRDGTMIGTVLYMSPEQCQSLQVDARSDLYSLGVLMYQTFCGRAVFEATTIPDVVAAHLKLSPVAPSIYYPELPLVLEQLILKLLEKEPSARYQSALKVRQVLELILKWEDLSGMFTPPFLQPISQPQALDPEIIPATPEGRDTELKALQSAIAGKTGVIALTGFADLDKTALINALGFPKKQRVLLHLECQLGDLDYTLISRIFARAYEVIPKSFDVIPETDRQELGRFIPAMAQSLWFSSLHDINDSALHKAVLLWFEKTKNRVLLAIENIQFADASSLRLINAALSHNPMLNIVVSSPSEFALEHQLMKPIMVIELKPLKRAT